MTDTTNNSTSDDSKDEQIDQIAYYAAKGIGTNSGSWSWSIGRSDLRQLCNCNHERGSS